MQKIIGLRVSCRAGWGHRLRLGLFLGCGWVLTAIISEAVWAETGVGDSGTKPVAEAPVERVPLTDTSVEQLDQQLEQLAEYKQVNRELEQLYRDSRQPMRGVIGMRVAENWATTMEASLLLADTVLALRDKGFDVEGYEQAAITELERHPKMATEAGQAISARMVLPDPDESLLDQASATNRLFSLIDVRDGLNQLIYRSLELSKAFALDVADVEESFGDDLAHRAANISVMLSMAIDEVKGTKQALSIVSNDPEAMAQLALAEQQVKAIAEALSATVSMLNTIGRDTVGYREQIIGATGEVSTDIFEPAVMWGLLRSWASSVLDVVVKDGPNVLLKILIFLAIVFVFKRLSRIVRKVVETALNRSNLRLSQLLRQMILSLCGNVVMVIGILIGLSQVGIALGPLLAGLGVAGFVIGFALQDTLSNFASGMMILTYRPFDVGDVVQAGGVSGTVSHMSLVNTTIMTFDNQTNVVPNNKIWGDVIKNVTAKRTRRVDFTFGIGYGDDIEKTERVLHEICDAHELVLKSPKPIIHLHQLADSSVNFIVRPWVKTVDYWTVYWDITRQVKLRFDAENISIPYPQSDVHIDVTSMPERS